MDANGTPLRHQDKKQATTATGGNSLMGGMTALLFAARDGHLDAVRALVACGADVNQVSAAERNSPLVIAIENGHYELAQFLIHHRADTNLANIYGLAPLYATLDMQYAPNAWAPIPITAQEKVTHLDLIKDLLEHGANPNARLLKKLWFRPSSHDQQWINTAGATAFWRAAQANDVPAMKLLVKHGADPKITSTGGNTALGMAAGLGWSGNFFQSSLDPNAWMDSVKYSLDLGLDVNAADKEGYTPLMGAAWRGNNELIQFLIEKGARLDARTRRGWSVTDMANAPALRNGVPISHPETIAFLLKLGAPSLTVVEGEAILGSRRFRKPETGAGDSTNGDAAKQKEQR